MKSVKLNVCWTVGCLLSACGGDGGGTEDTGRPARVEVSSQRAALTAQENTDAALRGVLNAAAFLAESTAVADGLSSMNGSSESCSTTEISEPCPADQPACTPTVVYEETCEVIDEPVTAADMMEMRDEMYASLDELVAFLRDEVFTDANLESEDGTYVVYKLPASLFCSEDSGAADIDSSGDVAPAPATTEPSQCELDYATLEPRLRLSSPGAGDVDVDVLLTAEQLNPMSLQLYNDRIGVSVDLGELKATLEEAGQDLEGVQELDGEVGLELVRNDDLDYSLRYNVLRDLVVRAGDAGEEIEFMLAATSPAMEIRADGNARTITGTLDYGTMNLIAPLGAFMDEEAYDDQGNLLPPKVYTGLIDAVAGGLNGSLTFDGNAEALTFEGLGLGDVSTTIKHDGNTLLSLDVNPDQNRRFDLRVESVAEGRGRLTFSPTLDVRLGLNFSHISNHVDDVPTFLMDDFVHLWFDGTDPALEVSEAALQVASGTLHLDSESAPDQSLSVEAGMCLVESASEEEPATVVAAFTSGACQ